MKFISSIQLLFALESLTMSLAEKEHLKIKQQNLLRGDSNDHSQALRPEVLTRDMRRRSDNGGNQLRNNKGTKLKDSLDNMLQDSKPVDSLTIINGVVSEENRYNYLVSLTDQSGNHMCGGSLITNNLVLTAAHCQGILFKAQIGRYNTADPYDKYEIFDVIGEIVHPEFSPKYLRNDFMIIKLSGKSTYPTITLSSKNQNIPEDLTVIGWGSTNIDGSYYRGPLLEANTKYIPNPQCRASTGYVNGVYASYNEVIKDDHMCADLDNSGSCFEAGGPLIAKGANSEDDIQFGIVSWGYGCNHPDFPDVYARIDNQIEWIQRVACILGHDDLNSNFDCKRREPNKRPPSISCNPKRGCDEGFTCILNKCVKDKDRNHRGRNRDGRNN